MLPTLIFFLALLCSCLCPMLWHAFVTEQDERDMPKFILLMIMALATCLLWTWLYFLSH